MPAQQRCPEVEFAAELVTAAEEEGKDVSRAQALLAQARQAVNEGGCGARAHSLAEQVEAVLEQAPMRPDFPYDEPEEWEGIVAAWAAGKEREKPPPPSDYLDHVYGGWLGKCIGGALGGPVEGWSRARIEERHGELTGYLATPDTLNDDTYYEIIALHCLETFCETTTPLPTSRDLALAWSDLLRLEDACTAERIAIENVRGGLLPPEAARHRNPYREWIGAQMRGEVWGLVAPGCPHLAAEYAYIDGIVSHQKNGLYGEIYDSVLVSLAFSEHDVESLVRRALNFVPQRSRLAEVVRDALAWRQECPTWQEAWERVEAKYGHYHVVHTLNNLAFVLIGLLYGEGDFGRSICITTMCGDDTDCTAGQVGAILGVIYDGTALPPEWKDPIGDYFHCRVRGLEEWSIRDLASRMCRVGERIAASVPVHRS